AVLRNPARCRTSRLAHRVLGDEHEIPGTELRHPYGRGRQHLSPPRERDRPERGGDRKDVRPLLAACPAPAGRGRRENVEAAEELFDPPRLAHRGLPTTRDSLRADDGGALPQPTGVLTGTAQGGGRGGQAAG